MYKGEFEPVIGLEIHAQLKTESKIFSSEPNMFGGGDNEFVHPVSLAMPGTLPVLNEKVVDLAILVGLAFHCEIKTKSVFSRKNYFYPDLAKGYQISQYDQPICVGGHVDYRLGETKKRTALSRIHLEEDAGKTTHHGDYSLVNYNRAGVPLIEIVSQPDLRSALEAAEYAKAVRRLLRYLGACDGNLEEGSLRCDCNVSLRPIGQSQLGTRVELKNINSFRFIEKAIEYEIQRQAQLLESGESVQQETRLYDSTKNRTFLMRSKEEAEDYRYFPDPDLLPLVLATTRIDSLRSQLCERPEEKVDRFEHQFGLTHKECQILTEDLQLARFYEELVCLSGEPKISAHWIITEVLRELNENKIEISKAPVSAESLAYLIREVKSGQISLSTAKTVYKQMWLTKESPESMIKKLGAKQISNDEQIESFVTQVLENYPEQVKEYQSGKQKVFGFLVGQAMKISKGQANPETLNRILKEKLK